MPASLLLLNPSPPRRRLRKNAWSHRAHKFSGRSRRTMAGVVLPSRKNPGKRYRGAGHGNTQVSKKETVRRRKLRARLAKKFGAHRSAALGKGHQVSGRRSGRSNPTVRIVVEAPSKTRVSHGKRAGVKKMTKKRRSAKQKAWAKKFGKKFGGAKKHRKNPRRKKHHAKRSNLHKKKRRKHRKSRKNPSRAQVKSTMSKHYPKSGAMHGPTRDTLTKHQKRVKAGKKAARTRKRNLAAKKGHKKSHKKYAKRAKSHKKHYKKSKFTRRIKSLGHKIKRTKKYARRKNISKKRRKAARQMGGVYRARRSALSVRRSLARGGVGGKYARAHGITRVNPSLAGLKTDLITLAPFAVAGIGSLIGLWMVSPKVTSMIPAQVTSYIPVSVQPFVPAIGSGILSVLAYWLLRKSKSPMLNKAASGALLGGLSAAALQTLVAWSVPNPQAGTTLPDGSKAPDMISMAKNLGLPLGEFVGVSGYITSASGQQIAVNGLGEFVGVSGSLVDASGQRIAVNGFGDYVPGEVGLGGGGIFSNSGSKSSLGRLGMAYDGNSNQDPGGREWSHGLSDETSAAEILDGDDEEGSLSGDIFGDN